MTLFSVTLFYSFFLGTVLQGKGLMKQFVSSNVVIFFGGEESYLLAERFQNVPIYVLFV